MENIEAGKKLDSLQGGEIQDYLPEEGHDTNGEATGRGTEKELEREKVNRRRGTAAPEDGLYPKGG